MTLAATGTQSAKAAARSAIARAAERTGVDFSYLLGQAQSESGLDASAHAAASSAAGLYQFIDQSWLGTIKQHGAEHGMAWAADAVERVGNRWTVKDAGARQAVFALRDNPDASALMAAASAQDNAAALRQTLGRAVNGTDLYMAHFLGTAGAGRFLRAADASPDASAAALFPREAAANHAIFYSHGAARSLGEVYALMGRKLGDGADAAIGATGDAAPTLMADGRDPLTKTPPATGARDAATFLAALDTGADDAPLQAMRQASARADLLRPQPAQARLAYMVVLSAIGA